MAGGCKGFLNQIGFGGWQLASMIARPIGIWPYDKAFDGWKSAI